MKLPSIKSQSEPGPFSARNFLFLQGHIGPFFQNLAQLLIDKGAKVHRINFNGGDLVSWNLSGAVEFRESIEKWPVFLARQVQAQGITDICLFGDCRPIHRMAIDSLRATSIAIHVFEEGYLRPDWITMESGGVNAFSSLPKNIEWYIEEEKNVNVTPRHVSVKGKYAERALWDVVYNASVALLHWRYREYKTHKPWPVGTEYWAGARRFFRRPTEKHNAKHQVDVLLQGRQPYFLFPLQLDADSQVRVHSPFGGMTKAIELAIDSFARFSASASRLVFTEHPLDNGVIPLRIVVEKVARERGIESRVFFLDGGSPIELLSAACGVITVNSTIGIQAIEKGVPVKVLGDAIYDLPLLTHQSSLDHFWAQPEGPQPDAVRAFINVVKSKTQINGCFFSRTGRLMAAELIRDRLMRNSAEAHSPRPKSEIFNIAPAIPELV